MSKKTSKLTLQERVQDLVGKLAALKTGQVVASKPTSITVRNSADAAEIVIDGVIGSSWYDTSGTTSNRFRDELSNIPKGRPINVRINSEGGAIGDALAIYNLLKERGDDVTCFNDGYCLSSGSIIALGGSKVISPASCIWMIHNPWSMTMGDESDHLKAAEMLSKHADVIAAIYAEKTGKSEAEMLDAMTKETWLTGDEAVDFGLADDDGDKLAEDDAPNADDDEQDSLNRSGRLVLARYRNIPPHVYNLLWEHNNPKAKPISVAQKSDGTAGTAASKTKQEKESNMPKENENPVAAAPAAVPANASNTELAQAVERERKARVTAEVKHRAENKIANDKLNWWIDAAMRDEETTFGQLDALPVQRPGGEPLGHVAEDKSAGISRFSVLSVVTHPSCLPRAQKRLDFQNEIKALKSPAERTKAMKRDWQGMITHAMDRDLKETPHAFIGSRDLPVAANTYSATLVTDFLVDAAITQLGNRWAALEAFSRDFSTDRFKQLATGQIKLITAGSSTLTATKSSLITNFEQGDGTVSPISVPMQHYSQPFHVAQDELMNGLRLENLTTINLAALSDTIIGKVLSVIGSSIFSAGTYYATAGTFGWTNEMPDLRGYLKKSPIKNLILDGDFYSRLCNQPGFFQPALVGERDSGRATTFGWDSIQENTKWDTAPANVAGLACNPQCIGVVAGLPASPPNIPGATLMESAIMVPGPDVIIACYVWFSLASRTLWTSYDVVLGAAAGDLTAAAVLYRGGGKRS